MDKSNDKILLTWYDNRVCVNRAMNIFFVCRTDIASYHVLC